MYQFPEIRTINDVLPHIVDYPEIAVKDKGDHTVICYNVAMAGTFAPDPENPVGTAIRFECRGLMFDKSGKLISRPFHKFKNVGEDQYSQLESFNFDEPYEVMEKLDGSMVRPVIFEYGLELCTKNGRSDVADRATQFLYAKCSAEQRDWMRDQFEKGFTPIFEYTGPDNQIVVEYYHEQLTLLAMRDNLTGQYVQLEYVSCPFSKVTTYSSDSFKDPELAVQQIKSIDDGEGVVIRSRTGYMLKIKSEWYVELHRVVDPFAHDRHVVKLIMDGQFDDVRAMVSGNNADRLDRINQSWDAKYHQALGNIADLLLKYREVDNKQIALGWDKSIDKVYMSMVFTVRNRDVSPQDALDSVIEKSYTSNTKFDATCVSLFGSTLTDKLT